MTNPLKNLPLNTKKVYAMEKASSGCEIYMPIDSFDDKVINKEKKELHDFLSCDEFPPMLA